MSTKREETERQHLLDIAAYLRAKSYQVPNPIELLKDVEFLTALALRSSPAGGGGNEEGNAYKAKSSEGAEQESDALDGIVSLVVREVAELPDRTSPDDAPDMMLVTADELESAIRSAFYASRAYAPQPPASEMVQGKEALEMLGEWHHLAEIGTREKWKTGDGRPSITSLWRDLAARQAPFLRAARGPIGSGSSADEGGSMTKDSGTHTRVDREALQNKEGS